MLSGGGQALAQVAALDFDGAEEFAVGRIDESVGQLIEEGESGVEALARRRWRRESRVSGVWGVAQAVGNMAAVLQLGKERGGNLGLKDSLRRQPCFSTYFHKLHSWEAQLWLAA